MVGRGLAPAVTCLSVIWKNNDKKSKIVLDKWDETMYYIKAVCETATKYGAVSKWS